MISVAIVRRCIDRDLDARRVTTPPVTLCSYPFSELSSEYCNGIVSRWRCISWPLPRHPAHKFHSLFFGYVGDEDAGDDSHVKKFRQKSRCELISSDGSNPNLMGRQIVLKLIIFTEITCNRFSQSESIKINGLREPFSLSPCMFAINLHCCTTFLPLICIDFFLTCIDFNTWETVLSRNVQIRTSNLAFFDLTSYRLTTRPYLLIQCSHELGIYIVPRAN